MVYVWILVLLLLLAFGPSLWVRWVMTRYAQPADRYRGSGGQLAEHLLGSLGLDGVKVEATEIGDHYDPQAKAVRLSRANYAGRSLTAVTVAAHEVGHALQDATGYGPLKVRTQLVRMTVPLQKLGAGILMLAPLAVAVTRAPSVTLLMIAGGLLSLGTAAIVHLVTLPTELDASFRRALPILEQGGYLHEGDLPHARRLLRAAAMTYVAGALLSLLSIGRWWAILRR